MATVGKKASTKVLCKWTPELITILIDLYTNIIESCAKPADNGALTKTQWLTVTQRFVGETKKDWDKSQLQSKMSEQKKNFGIVNAFAKLSGFGLDPTTGLVTADDDVWERFDQVSLYTINYSPYTIHHTPSVLRTRDQVLLHINCHIKVYLGAPSKQKMENHQAGELSQVGGDFYWHHCNRAVFQERN